MGFVRIFWKNNVQEAYLQKMSIWGQIVSEIVTQLCLQNSIQTLLNFFWVDPRVDYCGILPHDTNWEQTRCQQSANNNTVFLVVIIDIAVVTIIHTMDYNAVSWCNRQSDTLTLFFIVFNELGNCIILGQSQVPHKNLFWWPTRRQSEPRCVDWLWLFPPDVSSTVF